MDKLSQALITIAKSDELMRYQVDSDHENCWITLLIQATDVHIAILAKAVTEKQRESMNELIKRRTDA